MRKRIVLIALLLLSLQAMASPDPPTALSAEFVGYNSVKISWAHPGGQGVSFKVYKGSSPETASPIATVSENSFVDSGVSSNQEYVYFVTASDSSGESKAVQSVSVSPVERPDKPFSITLLSPEKQAFGFGEEVEFVIGIESPFFEELENLNAVLVNEDFAINQAFSLDQANKTFVLSTTLPEPQQEEGFSTTYTIRVNAIVNGQEFSESESYALALVPLKAPDTFQLALNILAVIGPPFLLLMLVSTVVFIGWRWLLQRKAGRDLLNLELLEIQKERILWKHETFKRKITPEQFREKEGFLQSRQIAVEEKLGVRKEKSHLKRNIFEGYSPAEINEIMRLVKTMKKPGKGMTQDSLRARLVGLGRSEKIAKKVAELAFRK